MRINYRQICAHAAQISKHKFLQMQEWTCSLRAWDSFKSPLVSEFPTSPNVGDQTSGIDAMVSFEALDKSTDLEKPSTTCSWENSNNNVWPGPTCTYIFQAVSCVKKASSISFYLSYIYLLHINSF